ncbi:MAG: DNA topoisomerase IB [Novosphingobium sp.]
MASNLLFVNAEDLTIERRKSGKSWQYRRADGSIITDAEEVARLNRIALPPAYSSGRFCPDPSGHIQAVGIDARGRSQYRYHPDYRASRDSAKYDRCVQFGQALPKLRARVARDLKGNPLAYNTVVAAIVRILDTGRLRIGNEAYARSNKSFGVTTLRNRHARVDRKSLNLKYRAKSGIMRAVTFEDKAVLRVVRRCQELRGQNLFQYLDASGRISQVTSGDVNDYLRAVTGEDFTAKDFRTWGGTVVAYAELCAAHERGEQPGIRSIAEMVATELGNTATIARKSYIHPRVIELVTEKLPTPARKPRTSKWLSAAERGVLALLAESGPKESLLQILRASQSV